MVEPDFNLKRRRARAATTVEARQVFRAFNRHAKPADAN